MDRIRKLCEEGIASDTRDYADSGFYEGPHAKRYREILSLLDAKPVSSGLSAELRNDADTLDNVPGCGSIRDDVLLAADALDAAEAEKREYETLFRDCYGLIEQLPGGKRKHDKARMVERLERFTRRAAKDRIAKRGGVNS